MDSQEINQYIIEYLRYNNYSGTLEHFESELRKQAAGKLPIKSHSKGEEPKICTMVRGDVHKSLNKKYNQVLQAARQIFSVSVSCLQLLHSLKEVRFNITSKNLMFIDF